VNGNTISDGTAPGISGGVTNLVASAIVPPGASYSCNSGQTLQTWWELR
jgi:hypothetical protein